MRYLSKNDLQKLVDMPTAIQLMRDAFVQISNGQAQVPIREHMHMVGLETEALFMPVYLPRQNQIGVKIVGLNPENLNQGMPLIHAMIMVMDAPSGKAIGLMEGSWITALRTGAGSGLATELMARPDAKVLGIWGAGVQARTQVAAVCAVRPIEKIIVWNRSPENGQQFVEELKVEYGIEVELARDSESMAEVEVLCLATKTSTPLFSEDVLPKGIHINAVGSYRADMAEFPPSLLNTARLVVDQQAASLKEAGEVIQAMDGGFLTKDHAFVELGEIAAGLKQGRNNPDEISLFKSVGNAAQDLVVASFAIQAAEKTGIGQEMIL